MYINEKKIISAIQMCIKEGEKEFAIFPYGKWGKVTKNILNNKYGIQEIAIIDNLLSADTPEIISVDEASKTEEKFTVLFATDNKQIREELLNQISTLRNVKICDIAMTEVRSSLYFSMHSPKMLIEECNEEQRNIIFEKTRKAWERLGAADPYWSVLTSDEYRMSNMDEYNLKKFYGTGYNECISILRTLERIGAIQEKSDAAKLEITEIGCGTGRVTKSLTEFFGKVNAFDISSGNMEIARKMVKNTNVNFFLIKNMNEYEKLPLSDVVYSMIVLQHNCPPVIEYMVDKMLGSLRKNGVAIFQVPTYKEDYVFEYDQYIKNSDEKMEMHVLPQKKIFEIAYKQKCVPMEVYQDSMTGNNDFSTTFVFRKM